MEEEREREEKKKKKKKKRRWNRTENRRSRREIGIRSDMIVSRQSGGDEKKGEGRRAKSDKTRTRNKRQVSSWVRVESQKSQGQVENDDRITSI